MKPAPGRGRRGAFSAAGAVLEEDEMDGLLTELVAALEEETMGWESLERLLTDGKTAVIGARIADVERISLDVEVLMQQLARAEKRRRDTVAALARAMGRPAAGLTLENLSKLVGGPHGEKLARCRLRLLRRLERIGGLNESVRGLLAHAVRMVGTAFSALNGMVTPQTVYGGGGKTCRGNQSGRMLSQSV